MSTAAPVVDVDQQTREELRPPCEATVNGVPCEMPADWILRWSCSCVDLACDQHTKEMLEIGRRLPIHCTDIHKCVTIIVSTERI